jgi:hypothetical protein
MSDFLHRALVLSTDAARFGLQLAARPERDVHQSTHDLLSDSQVQRVDHIVTLAVMALRAVSNQLPELEFLDMDTFWAAELAETDTNFPSPKHFMETAKSIQSDKPTNQEETDSQTREQSSESDSLERNFRTYSLAVQLAASRLSDDLSAARAAVDIATKNNLHLAGAIIGKSSHALKNGMEMFNHLTSRTPAMSIAGLLYAPEWHGLRDDSITSSLQQATYASIAIELYSVLSAVIESAMVVVREAEAALARASESDELATEAFVAGWAGSITTEEYLDLSGRAQATWYACGVAGEACVAASEQSKKYRTSEAFKYPKVSDNLDDLLPKNDHLLEVIDNVELTLNGLANALVNLSTTAKTVVGLTSNPLNVARSHEVFERLADWRRYSRS